MTLYLLPNLLTRHSKKETLPSVLCELVPKLDGLIAEGATSGQRFLSLFRDDAHRVPIALFNKDHQDCHFLLEPIEQGQLWGLVSDCGLPCLADPGSLIVKKARLKGLTIRALSGPSSIMQALMLSGLNVQSFMFHGYLPKGPEERTAALKRITKQPGTHLFIEAPHRNEALFQSLIQTMPETGLLCICLDLDTEQEEVHTKSIRAWLSHPCPLQKRLAVWVYTN